MDSVFRNFRTVNYSSSSSTRILASSSYAPQEANTIAPSTFAGNPKSQYLHSQCITLTSRSDCESTIIKTVETC